MTEITHERCSELLGPYSSGRLDDAARSDVDAHLATCPDCSRELAGLTALDAGEIEPMTGPEREVITAAVRAAVLGAEPSRSARWSARWSIQWGRRMAPALGAAALMAIAVVGYVSFQTNDSQVPAEITATQDEGRSTDEDRSTNATVEDADAETFGASKEAGGPAADAAQSQDMQIKAGTDAVAPGRAAAAIGVVVEERFARTVFTPDLFAPRDARTARNGEGGGGAATGTLLYAADDPALQSQVEECARTVTETSPYRLTPTYAAHFPDDDILVLGFVWRDEISGALNFELRGWRGDSCDHVSPIYRSGPV